MVGRTASSLSLVKTRGAEYRQPPALERAMERVADEASNFNEHRFLDSSSSGFG